jgi:hypothetical protein
MRLTRSIGAALGLSALALAFAGCSFLLGDPYGDFMQKAVAWVNLRAALQTNDGLTLNGLNAISVAVPGTGGTANAYVFVQGDFGNDSLVGALGYDTLDLKNFELPTSGGVLSTNFDVDGNIRIWAQSFDAGTLNLNSNLTGISPQSIGAWLIADGSASVNYLIYTSPSDSSNLLHMDAYSASWSPGSTETHQIGSATDTWSLARVAVLGDGRVCLLFFLGQGSQNVVLAETFKDFPTFASAMAAASPDLLDTAGVTSTSGIGVDSSNGSVNGSSGVDAWITENGIVSLTHGNGNNLSFSRYPLGPGGQIDGYSMSDNQSALFYFETSGKYWYYFDGGSGRFYRLRTWW